MGTLSISLVMDIILLACLGVTIFYAVRLSRSLNNFKTYRQEFLKLIGDLSRNIDKAENAIQGMKKTSADTGEHLQELIDESKLLAEELRLINDAGNNLAGRLENLAEQNSKIARGEGGDMNGAAQPQSKKQKEAFFIQDREFEAEEENEEWAMDEAGVSGELQSKAEKELYEALQKNRK